MPDPPVGSQERALRTRELAGGAAFPAARAAECAGQQNRFCDFHRLFYSTDRWIEDTSEAQLADIAAGQGLGIPGTPAFLIKGELHLGVLDSLRFESLVEELGEERP